MQRPFPIQNCAICHLKCTHHRRASQSFYFIFPFPRHSFLWAWRPLPLFSSSRFQNWDLRHFPHLTFKTFALSQCLPPSPPHADPGEEAGAQPCISLRPLLADGDRVGHCWAVPRCVLCGLCGLAVRICRVLTCFIHLCTNWSSILVFLCLLPFFLSKLAVGNLSIFLFVGSSPNARRMAVWSIF